MTTLAGRFSQLEILPERVRASAPNLAVVLTQRRCEGPKSTSITLRDLAVKGFIQLKPDEGQLWREFARTRRRYSSLCRRVTGPTARNLYIRLAIQRWGLDSSLPAPTTPPARAIMGDEVGIFAKRAPFGTLRFTATESNQEGTVTELLAQPIKRLSSKSKTNAFRTLDFVAFSKRGQEVDFFLPSGYYATAHRFVHVDSMQCSPLIETGTVSITWTVTAAE